MESISRQSMERMERFTNMRNYNQIPDYSKRHLFLDPAGVVTTQRYDDYAYPKIAKFDETQRGAFWVPEEITLTKDKIDFKEASKAVRHIFTSNLLRQTTLDSIQGRAPAQIFTPVVSVPEMENLVTTWTWFEQIHSRAYSHIIRNIYNVPKDEFNKIHDNSEIIGMISSIGKYYDDLHLLNCKKEAGLPVTEHEHVRAIWLALIASYGLEAIRFTVSFATSLGMVENKIFIGNGNEISLILSDEMLHVDWTAYLINTLIKDDPRFTEVARETQKECYEMLLSVVNEEKAWAKYLFKEGSVIGQNEKTMIAFVDWTAQYRLKDIGLRYDAGIKNTPLPWFNKHLNTNKKQTALQENESTAYIIHSMTNNIDYEQLPEL
jgi:ribonucleoside-diphosphate reductase beta chain